MSRASMCLGNASVCFDLSASRAEAQSARQHTCIYTSPHHAYTTACIHPPTQNPAPKPTHSSVPPSTCIALPVNQHCTASQPTHTRAPALLHRCAGMSVRERALRGLRWGSTLQGMCWCASVSVLIEKSCERWMQQCGGGVVGVGFMFGLAEYSGQVLMLQNPKCMSVKVYTCTQGKQDIQTLNVLLPAISITF